MGGPMVDEIRHGTGLQSATYSIAPIYASEYMWIMEKVRETFLALSDPTRLRALALMAEEGEVCVCELVAALGEVQPKISRHLAVLRDAGIVTVRKDARWIHYTIAPGSGRLGPGCRSGRGRRNRRPAGSSIGPCPPRDDGGAAAPRHDRLIDAPGL